MPGKRSAPPGNARKSSSSEKHDFYSKVLDEVDKADLEEAAKIEGIDDEIALMRVSLRKLIEQYPENIEVQMRVINTLTRLIRTKYNISKEQRKSLKEAITKVLTEVAIPLGVKFIPK
jgi:hypothetical protein